MSRINLLEAEIITTAIACMEAAELADRQVANAETFRLGISDSVNRVAAQSRDLGERSRGVVSSAHAMEVKMREVAGAAEETAVAMADAAASSSDITSSIGDLRSEAAGLDRTVDDALCQIIEAEQQCAELEKQASTMEAVVEIVRSIAQRTKLLALNATIEAARAGDAGRGFSVVAQEVKSLSSQTEEAIDSISLHVLAMQGATARTTEAHSIIKSAVSDVKRSSGRVERIADTQLTRSAMIASAIDQSACVVRATSEAVAAISGEGHGMSVAFGDIHAKLVDVDTILADLEKSAEAYVSCLLPTSQ